MQPRTNRFLTLLGALCGAILVHAALMLGLFHYGAARSNSVRLLDVFSVVVLSEALALVEPLPVVPEEVPPPQQAPEPFAEPEPVPEPPVTQQRPAVPDPPTIRPRPKPKEESRAKSAKPPRETAVAAHSGPAPSATPVALAHRETYTPPRSDADYLHNPRPTYPRQARQQRMQGRVLLEVRVSEEGVPLTVALRSSSGFTLLDQAASEAVLRWRFIPARRGGRAVEAAVEVPIRFVINEEK